MNTTTRVAAWQCQPGPLDVDGNLRRLDETCALSVICGPRGEVLAQAGAQGEELIIADLPGESAGTYLADRRADLYEGTTSVSRRPGGADQATAAAPRDRAVRR